jgi:hypothetical protein
MIRLSRWAVVAAAATAAACGGGDGGGGPVDPGPTPQPKPIILEMVSGNAQGGLPGEILTHPLVVRATRDGQPLPNVSIDFTATGGTVNLSVATTGGTGQAEVHWRLPADPAAVAGARVNARLTAAPAGQPVAFAARTLRQDEMDLVIAEGGVPVKMVVYDRGAFNPAQWVTRSFTDSAHVFFGRAELWDDLVAFTPGRAPLLLPAGWTPGRDTVRLRFSEQVIRLPITIWVMQPPFDSTVILVQRHLQGVADTWEAQAGIGLRDVRIVDATGFPGAVEFQDSFPRGCNAGIKSLGFDLGRLNAYYVGQPPLGSAAHCGTAWMEVYSLAWERMPYTLAHEIGHTFLGNHHETVPNNVMHFRGDGATFTQGQMFRAHYSELSLLNTMFNAYPAVQQRACSQVAATPDPLCLPTDFVVD